MARRYGITFEGNDWTIEAKMVVVRGAMDTAHALHRAVQEDEATAWENAALGEDPAEEGLLSGLWGKSETEVFKEVLGPVTFKVASQCGAGDDPSTCVDANAWAWSRIGDRGEVWVNENALTDADYLGFEGVQNTVHELMHGIDQRGGGVAGQRLDVAMQKTNSLLPRSQGGFAPGGFPGWQQSREPDASEVFADMGLGWTYGQWGANDVGVARSQYMAANMPMAIALAVAAD